ncbi:hypothetical protein [Fibrella forsythiae]|uniref:DUF1772 domain-containing protein n=1 Tax=Fibrella forsythiae TaxID=2817061 RepID=A0ABS3JK05_9BACT|nr:hypothetical protein [Fibrella forsythiae]MBO0949756.1 hypothetical protein [Fibrella forsythiae]
MEDPIQLVSVIDEPTAKSNVMTSARTVFLLLLLIVTGLYAGIHFSGMLNPSIFGIINPAGDLMPSVRWAESWQITDRFMGARMRIFGPFIMASYVLTIGLFIGQWRKPILWLLVSALALFFYDLYFTIQHQVPINQYIQTLHFDHLSSDQIRKIKLIHPIVIANFQKRELLSIGSFILVALTPFLRRTNSKGI